MEKVKGKNVVVIILNYINYFETIECVESVLNQNYTNYNILIVDNGSNNNSFSYLFKQYKNNAKVTVIRSRKNYGFAKGNNIGICYAKKKFNVDYVMLLNSDTIVDDREYLSKMVGADKEGIGVIGSKIINSDNKEVYWNQYVTFPATLLYYLMLIAICGEHPLYQVLFKTILTKCKSTNIIEGSALMLTPTYFQYYDYLDSRTFLYCEEELLYLRCKKKMMKMLLNNNACVYHKYGRSSRELHDNNKKGFYSYLKSSYKFVVWESIKMIFSRPKFWGDDKVLISDI